MKQLNILIKRFLVLLRKKSKKAFDSIDNEKIKLSLLNALPFWTGALLTGLVAVGYARLFSSAEGLAESIFHTNKYLLLLVTPVCFIAAWWIVKKYAPNARGSGIPQVMASLELTSFRQQEKISLFLSLRIIAVKIVSSVIMAIGGGVVGREGPTIQISGSIFRVINNNLPVWWPKISRKNMIMAGAAAGLAAAFNTPLGGIVFAVEELSKTHINYFKKALFISVILAGLTAQFFLGSYLYLGYPSTGNLSFSLFFAIILVAGIAGIASTVLCKFMVRIIIWIRSLNTIHKIFFILFCALLLSSLALYDARILGSGKSLINHLLFTNDKYCSWLVPALKMIGSLVSFSFGAAGGVFAPALSMGAGIGSCISGVFHFSATDSNLLILTGMVAFLTGVTRSPFTCAILILEMTGGHNIIFQLMAAAIISAAIAGLIDKTSFYERLKDIYLHDVGATKV